MAEPSEAGGKSVVRGWDSVAGSDQLRLARFRSGGTLGRRFDATDPRRIRGDYATFRVNFLFSLEINICLKWWRFFHPETNEWQFGERDALLHPAPRFRYEDE
jgi:hypothetical protein